MNYYTILGISETSSLDDIKRAYRKQAMKHHPDRGGDASLFSQINFAYNYLTNLHTKSEDEYGFDWTISDEDFEDLAHSEPEQNKDLAINVHIALENCYNNNTIEARYELLSGKFQTVTLDIPLGIKSNETIQYQGLGDDSIGNAPRGDLVVTYIVDPHDSFIRRSDDLCTSLNISAFEAMCGTIKNITALSGEIYQIQIQPGTQPNSEIVYPNCGFYNRKKNKYGNFIVIIIVDVPKITDMKKITSLMKLHSSYYS